MKQHEIPWTPNNHGRNAHYKTHSGWPVLPDDVLPGSVVLPDGNGRLPAEELLVRPHAPDVEDDVESCDFCNDRGHVMERGIVPADYVLVSRWDLDETVAHTCHCCISGAPVKEYNRESFDPDDIFLVRDD